MNPLYVRILYVRAEIEIEQRIGTKNCPTRASNFLWGPVLVATGAAVRLLSALSPQRPTGNQGRISAQVFTSVSVQDREMWGYCLD